MFDMKRFLKKAIAFCIVLITILSLPCNAFAEHKDYSKDELAQAIQDIITWKKADMGLNSSENLFGTDFVTSAGSPSTDWYAIAVGRMEVDDNYSAYLSMLKKKVVDKYETEDKLDPKKATEWHRISLAMLSLGGDPTKVGDNKINLIADGTYNRGLSEPLDSQGINGLIWGLITVDAMCYDIPENSADTRRDIIEKILRNQNSDGSFSLIGNSEDIDITAMAVTALSTYYNSNETVNGLKIRDYIDKSVNFLSQQQKDNGGFADGCVLESTAQTIIALCSLGIDPVNDIRFIKGNNNLLDALMSYQQADGGFVHSPDDKKSNSIASEQAMLALISLYRYQNNMRKLYDFRAEATDSPKNEENNILFNENDVNQFNALPKKLTTEHYAEVLYLFDKLNGAENKQDYSETLDLLTEKKAQIEKIRENIENINNEILENLYPFDSVSIKDKDTIESIYKESQQLSDYDKKQVLGYEDLIKARMKVQTLQRNMIIKIALIIVLLILTSILLLRIRKHRIDKKKDLMHIEDNQDW